MTKAARKLAQLATFLLLILPMLASDAVPTRFGYPRLGPPWPKPVRPSWISKGVVFVGDWEPLQWAYRKNWQNWGNAASGKRAEEIHRLDRSEETLIGLKKMGVNMVLSSFHKGFGIENEKYNMDEAREWGKLLHKHGMKLGVLVSTLLIYEDLYHEFPEAKDWHRIKFDGTPDTYSGDGYRYRASLNHPAYVDYMKRVCELAVKAGVDAIFFDTAWQEAEDHHPLNQQMFRDWLKQKYPDDRDWFFRTGLHYRDYVKVPHYTDRYVSTFDQPIAQEYIQFRSQMVADFCAEFATFIHRLNPETAFWVNLMGANLGGNSAWLVSFDSARLLPWLDLYYSEEHDYADYSKNGGIISKIRTIKPGSRLGAVHTNATGETPGGDRGLDTAKNDPRLRLAEEMAFNRASLGNIGYGASHVVSTFPETGRQYIRFFWKSQDLLQGCQSAADVAVLRSFASMSFNSFRTHQETMLAEQALIQAQVPFDILYDDDLASLSKYKVLVLAGQESLSDKQMELIRSFVQRGGGVVATADASFYDEWRRQREGLGLADVLGLASADSHTAASRHEFGKGRAAYIPTLIPAVAIPAATNMAPRYWAPPKNAAEFVKDVRWAGGKLDWEFTAPPFVAVEAYRQPDKNRYILHFLNYNCKTKPAVDNIQVTVRATGAGAKLRVYSPDHPEVATAKAVQTADGIKFTLPKLSIYSIITVEK